MFRYKCEICSAITKCNDTPALCVGCGTVNGSWTKLAPATLKLMAADQKMIIYKDCEIGRAEFKLYFSSLVDNAGNLLYKYCNENISMLQFAIIDELFYVLALNSTKNYFTLNSVRIGAEKIKISDGDKLHLFSSTQKEIVGSLTFQL